jgi:hypothetical protein
MQLTFEFFNISHVCSSDSECAVDASISNRVARGEKLSPIFSKHLWHNFLLNDSLNKICQLALFDFIISLSTHIFNAQWFNQSEKNLDPTKATLV